MKLVKELPVRFRPPASRSRSVRMIQCVARLTCRCRDLVYIHTIRSYAMKQRIGQRMDYPLPDRRRRASHGVRHIRSRVNLGVQGTVLLTARCQITLLFLIGIVSRIPQTTVYIRSHVRSLRLHLGHHFLEAWLGRKIFRIHSVVCVVMPMVPVHTQTLIVVIHSLSHTIYHLWEHILRPYPDVGVLNPLGHIPVPKRSLSPLGRKHERTIPFEQGLVPRSFIKCKRSRPRKLEMPLGSPRIRSGNFL